MTMTDGTENPQLNNQAPKYSTVIPVEYTRNRGYSNTPASDYVVEQYSRAHDDYIQTEELSTSQGALYSVSQRVPPASTSYASLCPTDAGFVSEQGGYSSLNSEWECDRAMSTSDAVKDGSSDALSDKQTNVLDFSRYCLFICKLPPLCLTGMIIPGIFLPWVDKLNEEKYFKVMVAVCDAIQNYRSGRIDDHMGEATKDKVIVCVVSLLLMLSTGMLIWTFFFLNM